MKKIIVFALALLCLVGCSDSKTTVDDDPIEKYGSDVLNVFNWGEYIGEDVIANFEEEYGVKVNYSMFDSNEILYTKLLGGTSYDVIVPSDYMIERLMEEGMLQPLDYSYMTNLDDLDPGVVALRDEYDPDGVYSMPYFWGSVGLIYNKKNVDVNKLEELGWNILKDTEYADRIFMYDSERDSFMVALKALGYSMNTTNENEIQAAFNWLVEQRKTMDPTYATDDSIDNMKNGEKALCVMYSGDAAYILSENENMRYYAPDEGTNYFVDAMVIQKGAKNVENAYKFMNYITDYDAAFENSLYVGYASVNKEVLRDLTLPDGDFDGNEAYIPRDRNSHDEVFHNNEKQLATISELWVKVKNH